MQTPKDFLNVVQNAGLPDWRYFETIDSTNLNALQWLNDDARDGSIVFANHQSAGRGRSERQWVTNPHSSIAISIVLRLNETEQQNLQLFSALAGVALAITLQKNYSIDAAIKWPNDVLIDKQKTAGILTEAAWNGDQLDGIVVGVGINILPDSIPPVDKLQFPATCIQQHTTKIVDRFTFLGQFLQSFFEWREKVSLPIFINQWEKLLAFRDETVYIKETDIVIFSGILSGIESNGDLRIISEEGIIKKFTVGDVHLRPASS